MGGDIIFGSEVRLIDVDGTQLGIKKIQEAISLAQNKDLDLIEVSPNAKPPVCKIGDFGKYIYEQQKKEKVQKKNQQVSQLKEIKFHSNTDKHDIEFKTRHLREFLIKGNKVKITLDFVGRQIEHKHLGESLINNVVSNLSEVSKIDAPLKLEGKKLYIILSPDKTKIEKIKSISNENS
jgi:translation initiation factor IF-3